jgi:hypothetical protein
VRAAPIYDGEVAKAATGTVTPRLPAQTSAQAVVEEPTMLTEQGKEAGEVANQAHRVPHIGR